MPRRLPERRPRQVAGRRTGRIPPLAGGSRIIANSTLRLVSAAIPDRQEATARCQCSESESATTAHCLREYFRQTSQLLTCHAVATHCTAAGKAAVRHQPHARKASRREAYENVMVRRSPGSVVWRSGDLIAEICTASDEPFRQPFVALGPDRMEQSAGPSCKGLLVTRTPNVVPLRDISLNPGSGRSRRYHCSSRSPSR